MRTSKTQIHKEDNSAKSAEKVKFRNFKEEIDFFFNFRDRSSSFVLLLSWLNWIGKMWNLGVTRGKTWSNAKLNLSEDAFIIETG